MKEAEQEVTMTSFLEVMKELRNGASLVELSERITEVVAAVRNVGKAGKITLELTIRPWEKGREEITRLVVSEKIKTEVPQMERADTVFFSTHENVLLRDDPRQMGLELKVVEPPVMMPLKEVV